MKQLTAAILLTLLLFALLGCSSQDSEYIEPVNFYYCNDLDSKEDFENIFVAEVREGVGYVENKPALLSLYLSGPQNGRLISPFPAGTALISVQKTGDMLQIVFSDHLAQLTGLDLTIAATCISLTVFELYPCAQVEISCEGALLDEQVSLTMFAEDLVLVDEAYTMPGG